MSALENLTDFIANIRHSIAVEDAWQKTSESFAHANAQLPSERAMARTELSFHEDVKLLGYLCLLVSEFAGDIVEIGVWKGKSLAFMGQLVGSERKLIGVDPLELWNQESEISFYKERIFPRAFLFKEYSELAVSAVMQETQRIAVLHIDGGHLARNVLLDFLLYSPLVVPGGYIVFDDYRDFIYSPEVGPTVDLLRVGGFFNGYEVLGPVPGYETSYLLRRLP